VATQSLWCPIILILLLVGDGVLGSPTRAQTIAPPTISAPQTTQANSRPPAQAGTPPEAGITLPVDLSRIKGGLSTQVHVRIDDGRVRFYAEVTAPRGKSFKELSVNFDLRKGPVPGASMTHQEFLGMVTPRLRYYPGAGESLKVLAWGLGESAAWWGIRKLYRELDEAKDERRRQQIQSQIDRELAALRGGGR
jgi:hypothetical protein